MKIAYYRPLATGHIPDPDLAYCSQTSQNRSPQFFRISCLIRVRGHGGFLCQKQSTDRQDGRVWKGIRVIIQLALLGIPHSLFNAKPSLFSTKPSLFNYHYVNLYCKYLSFHEHFYKFK